MAEKDPSRRHIECCEYRFLVSDTKHLLKMKRVSGITGAKKMVLMMDIPENISAAKICERGKLPWNCFKS